MTYLRLAPETYVCHEIEIRRSRFITLARRVDSMSDARTLVAEARSEFPDARHHCSAFIISEDGAQPLMHSSDDGEPSGTAGRPMLDVLQGFNLVDIATVVVRYFGGTLLGTGGLVRAYSDSVREALLNQPIVEQLNFQLMSVAVAHGAAGKFEAEVRNRGYEVVDVSYSARLSTYFIAVANVVQFESDIAELTSGSAVARSAGHILRERDAGTVS